MADEPTTPAPVPEKPAAPAEPWYKTGGFDEAHQKVLGKYATPEEAHKALVAAQPLIHSKVALPKEDASPEEKAKARRSILGKLGAPDTADAFELDKVLPESIRSNPHYGEYKDKLGALLVAEGVMPDTLKKLFDVENELAGILGKDYEASRTEGIKALQAKVGGGEAGWKTYKEQAQAAAVKFGSDALGKLVSSEENPALMAAMHELWHYALREGTALPGGETPKLPDTGKAAPFSDAWYSKPSAA